MCTVFIVLLQVMMENIFGKEDSGIENEYIDIDNKDDKDNSSQNSTSKNIEVMDVDGIQIKV